LCVDLDPAAQILETVSPFWATCLTRDHGPLGQTLNSEARLLSRAMSSTSLLRIWEALQIPALLHIPKDHLCDKDNSGALSHPPSCVTWVSTSGTHASMQCSLRLRQHQDATTISCYLKHMVDNVCHLCTGNAIDHRADAMIHGKSRGEATVQVYAADARSHLPQPTEFHPRKIACTRPAAWHARLNKQTYLLELDGFKRFGPESTSALSCLPPHAVNRDNARL
jgi:hypothetical protein